MSELYIENRAIGTHHRPFIIAEAGINHEGSFEKAIQLIDSAKSAGAECIKFQCHIISDEMSGHAQRVIPGNTDVSIYEVMDRCKLSLDDELRLKLYAEKQGLIYLSTPFSRAAADFLNEIGVVAFKIGSGECNNYPLIEHISKFKKPVILSTGMNSLENISRSVAILESNNCKYALLHCTSIYPTPDDLVGLPIIDELISSFPEAVVGMSDHSLSIYPLLGAVARGASILERHFTVSKEWPGPDIEVSMDPNDLSKLIEGSNRIFEACKRQKKGILEQESATINFAYASVVSIKKINKGDVLSKDNIWVKRPGTGEFKASDFQDLIGRFAGCDIEADEQIQASWLV